MAPARAMGIAGARITCGRRNFGHFLTGQFGVSDRKFVPPRTSLPRHAHDFPLFGCTCEPSFGGTDCDNGFSRDGQESLGGD